MFRDSVLKGKAGEKEERRERKGEMEGERKNVKSTFSLPLEIQAEKWIKALHCCSFQLHFLKLKKWACTLPSLSHSSSWGSPPSHRRTTQGSVCGPATARGPVWKERELWFGADSSSSLWDPTMGRYENLWKPFVKLVGEKKLSKSHWPETRAFRHLESQMPQHCPTFPSKDAIWEVFHNFLVWSCNCENTAL